MSILVGKLSATAGGANDSHEICAARSRVDSARAEPKIEQTVLIRPAPRFVRQAMVQLRDSRQRLGSGFVGHRPLRETDPIAEFILQEASTIDLRVESSRADHNLRTARLASRAAALLEQIAQERAASDAHVTVPPAPDEQSRSPLIPAQNWDELRPDDAAEPHVDATLAADAGEDDEAIVATLEQVITTIRLVGQLRDEGLVTEAEFRSKKEQLLARI